MTLIDRTELRRQVNKLYATATPEQQKILLGVMELIESAPAYIRDKTVAEEIAEEEKLTREILRCK